MLAELLYELLTARFSLGFPVDGATVEDALLTSFAGEATACAGSAFIAFFKGRAPAAKGLDVHP